MRSGLLLIELLDGSAFVSKFSLVGNLPFSVAEAKKWLKARHNAKSVKPLKSTVK